MQRTSIPLLEDRCRCALGRGKTEPNSNYDFHRRLYDVPMADIGGKNLIQWSKALNPAHSETTVSAQSRVSPVQQPLST